MVPDRGFRTGLFDDYSACTASEWRVVPGSLRILPEQVFPAAEERSVPDRRRAGWRAWLHAVAFVDNHPGVQTSCVRCDRDARTG